MDQKKKTIPGKGNICADIVYLVAHDDKILENEKIMQDTKSKGFLENMA
jgi:hypothetical protein